MKRFAIGAVGALGSLAILLLAASAAYFSLQTACSSHKPPAKLTDHVKPSGSGDNTKDGHGGDQSAAPEGSETKPTATFKLRITKGNEIEGNYYAENREGEKEDWAHKFWCDTKIGEFVIAIFTVALALFTGGLWLSTHRLWKITRTAAEHIPRVERAYMFGGPANNATTFDNPPGTVRVVIDIKNHGKTPGVLVETYGEFLESAPDVPPDQYAFSGGQKWEYDNVFSADDRPPAKMDHQPFTGPKHETVYFIGYIKYRTVLDDKIHTSYWCVTPRVVNNVLNVWALHNGTPGWNSFD